MSEMASSCSFSFVSSGCSDSSGWAYSEEIATFGEEDVYNQHDAEGFINLFGLPLKVRAMLEQKKLK